MSKEMRERIGKIFEEKKKKGTLTDLEDMFGFIVEEMPDCPDYD